MNTTLLTRERSTQSMSSETILWYRDNGVNAESDSFENNTHPAGYSVKHVENQSDLFHMLHRHDANVLVWDMTAPGPDAFVLLRQLQDEQEIYSAPLVVLIDEIFDSQLETQLYQEGADLVLVKPVADETLQAVLKSRITRSRLVRESSRVDMLTGLPTHAAMEEIIYRDTALANREQLPLSFGLIRIDNYKALRLDIPPNSLQGLQKRIGSMLQAVYRKSDTVAMWDERTYAVLWPNTHRRGAVLAAEKALTAINELTMPGSNSEELTPELVAGVIEVTRMDSIEEAIDKVEQHLYLAEESETAKVVFSEGPAAMAHEKTIYLVMNDNLTASMASHRLEKSGFHVENYTTAADALEQMKKENVHAFILDSQIADMDGYDLIRQIRSREEHERTPLILLSFTSAESEVVRAFDAGADDFISKPFSTTELTTRLQRLLRIL